MKVGKRLQRAKCGGGGGLTPGHARPWRLCANTGQLQPGWLCVEQTLHKNRADALCQLDVSDAPPPAAASRGSPRGERGDALPLKRDGSGPSRGSTANVGGVIKPTTEAENLSRKG